MDYIGLVPEFDLESLENEFGDPFRGSLSANTFIRGELMDCVRQHDIAPPPSVGRLLQTQCLDAPCPSGNTIALVFGWCFYAVSWRCSSTASSRFKTHIPIRSSMHQRSQSLYVRWKTENTKRGAGSLL